MIEYWQVPTSQINGVIMKINPVYFQRNVKQVSNLQNHLTDIKTKHRERESSNLQSLVIRQTNKQATKLQQRILLDPKLERRMANSNHRFGVKFKSC